MKRRLNPIAWLMMGLLALPPIALAYTNAQDQPDNPASETRPQESVIPPEDTSSIPQEQAIDRDASLTGQDQSDAPYGDDRNSGDQAPQIFERDDLSGQTSDHAAANDRTTSDDTASLGSVFVDSWAGVYVNQVFANSPAQAAGLMPGDRVETIDGQEVRNAMDVVRQIEHASVGDQIELVVCRHGTLYALTPTLAAQSDWLDSSWQGMNPGSSEITVFRPDYDQPMPANKMALQSRVEQLERQVQELEMRLLDLQQTIGNSADGKTAANEEPDPAAGAIIRDDE